MIVRREMQRISAPRSFLKLLTEGECQAIQPLNVQTSKSVQALLAAAVLAQVTTYRRQWDAMRDALQHARKATPITERGLCGDTYLRTTAKRRQEHDPAD